MIVRHHDIKKNEFERFHDVWKTKDNETSKEFKFDRIQQNENLNALRKQQFISDNDETKSDQAQAISILNCFI